MRVSLARPLSLLLLAFVLGGCGRLIAEYSLQAYTNATSLKAETLAMIDKSGEAYSLHAKEVDALNVKIDAAYEFSAGIPANQLSATQWAILRDPNRNLWGGFAQFWKTHGTVSAFFRQGVKKNIGDAFDEIICLEANKQAQTSCIGTKTADQRS
jgi:hypothetical protein